MSTKIDCPAGEDCQAECDLGCPHCGQQPEDFAVNLDCEFLDPDDLQKWEPDPRLTKREQCMLRLYRNKKVMAMKARLAGDIRNAKLWEDHCEFEYDCMPERIKW